MNWTEQALAKLDRESETGRYNRCADIMKNPVRNLLADFCRENPEFAQAVVQGGTFEDCMKTVAKDCGVSLKDPEAYQRAVQFYFPGAVVRTHYKLDLTGDAQDDPCTIINLVDFF